MKIWIFCVLLFLMISCRQEQHELFGDWTVESTFYQSSCRIFEENHAIKGLVLYYNDGTTSFSYPEGKSYYLFENLKRKKNIYVDGMTGATAKKTGNNALQLEVKSKDTLLMTNYIMGQALTEIWTRIK